MTEKSPFRYMVRFLPYKSEQKALNLCVQISENQLQKLTEDENNNRLRDKYVGEFNSKHGGIKVNHFPCLYLYSFKTLEAFDNFVTDLTEIYHIDGVIENSFIVDVLSGFPSIEYANACLSYVFDQEVALCDILSMLDYEREYWGDIPIASKQVFNKCKNTNTEYLGYYLENRSNEIQAELEELRTLITSVNSTMEEFRAKRTVQSISSSLDQTPESVMFQGMWMS